VPVTVASGFSSPVGVAVAADGALFVADYMVHAVKRVPFVNGSYGTPVVIGS